MSEERPSAISGSISNAWVVIVAAVISYLLCPTPDTLALQLRVLLGIVCALVISNAVSKWNIVRITNGNLAFVVSSCVGIAGALANELGHWLWL